MPEDEKLYKSRSELEATQSKFAPLSQALMAPIYPESKRGSQTTPPFGNHKVQNSKVNRVSCDCERADCAAWEETSQCRCSDLEGTCL